jgi:cyclophilin family peptidyl-prolyl cis-trans isomerase
MPGAVHATIVRFETPLGSFDVELFDDVTPLTVVNFLNYVNDGDYENSFIHRKINGFIVQGGGFTFENGVLGNVPEDAPVINEFNLSNVRGTIAMAKIRDDPNSATSGWFVNLADNSANLDGQNGGFTVFGRVLDDGMDVVDAIAALPNWNLGGALTQTPLIDFTNQGPVQAENLVFTGISIVPAVDTDIDVTGVADISGDAVPDVVHLTNPGQPKVRYYSGASRKIIKGVSYLGQAWSGVAAATVVDGNSNGVANDPAVAVLGHKASADKHAVEVRRADNGALINKIFFLSSSWTVIDVAVIDDKNGDGVTGDTAIAVLGVNPDKPFNEQIRVQVRRLSDGKQLANWFFLNGNWTPLALEAVNRIGQTPLLAVLANKAATGANVVQARKFSNGSVQRDTSFFNAGWLARDVSVVTDSDGDGNPNDPAYLVLANHLETGRNKVQARRANDGARLQNITMLGTNWEGMRVTGTGDISGNLREEVGVLAAKKTDGTVAIQLKDYEDRSTTATIFP